MGGRFDEVWWCWVVCLPSPGGGRTAPGLRNGLCWFVGWYRVCGPCGVGGCSSLVVLRCGPVPCDRLVFPPVFLGPWAVQNPCGVGLEVPWGRLRGIRVPQPAGCGCVAAGCDGPPVRRLGGVGSAVCALGAGRRVCGVRGSVCCGVSGIMSPRWGACVWGVASGGGGLGLGLVLAGGRSSVGSGCWGVGE